MNNLKCCHFVVTGQFRNAKVQHFQDFLAFRVLFDEIHRLITELSETQKLNQSLQQSNDDLRNRNGLKSRREQEQLEKEIKDVRNQNCNLEELVDMSSAKAVRQAKEKQRELEKQLQSMKYQAEQNRRIAAKEIQKLKKRVELQLEKISEIKLFCGIGYVAAVIFAVCQAGADAS